MDHAAHVRLQTELLDEVMVVLRSEPDVLGVAAAGSMARGEQDAFSDIDIACFFRGEKRSRRPAIYERIGGLAPLLCKLWLYDVHALYLFGNGVRLDLDFYRESDVSKGTFAYPDVVTLYDPDGALALVSGSTLQPRPAGHPASFQAGDEALLGWFFWMLRQAVCWAKRGAQGGERAFDKLSAAVDSLSQVRARLVEMWLWTLGAHEYLGRADPGRAKRLGQTYPTLSADAVIACAFLLLDEYERVVEPYCRKAGAEFPKLGAERMRALIAEFEQLR